MAIDLRKHLAETCRREQAEADAYRARATTIDALARQAKVSGYPADAAERAVTEYVARWTAARFQHFELRRHRQYRGVPMTNPEAQKLTGLSRRQIQQDCEAWIDIRLAHPLDTGVTVRITDERNVLYGNEGSVLWLDFDEPLADDVLYTIADSNERSAERSSLNYTFALGALFLKMQRVEAERKRIAARARKSVASASQLVMSLFGKEDAA